MSTRALRQSAPPALPPPAILVLDYRALSFTMAHRPWDRAAIPRSDLAGSYGTLIPFNTRFAHRVREVPRLTIRPARVGDVPGIYELVAVFAERKLMIRRSMAELYESIREFIVA